MRTLCFFLYEMREHYVTQLQTKINDDADDNDDDYDNNKDDNNARLQNS